MGERGEALGVAGFDALASALFGLARAAGQVGDTRQAAGCGRKGDAGLLQKRCALTLQQAIVDVALDDPDASVESLRAACLRVRAAGREQERLIETLLTLARSQRGLQRREFVDLAEVVRARLPEGGPRVETDLGRAPVLGDPQLIERLVVNLADNAVRHNHPDGEESWVRVWTGLDGGRPVLRIANSGPVIPPGQMSGLFQPFRRLGAERVGKRDGLGLGLSIVAAVVAAHGGTVEAWSRPEGGLSVRVGFPPGVPAQLPVAVGRTK
ncbi:sensor histidine kinase [Streptomyces sp. NPDC127595]|uniref:sensor histidine kinase n=1 Tax=Streptomyces sp. NPDC127595 TaxID=3345405 RepID=UPI00362D6745